MVWSVEQENDSGQYSEDTGVSADEEGDDDEYVFKDDEDVSDDDDEDEDSDDDVSDNDNDDDGVSEIVVVDDVTVLIFRCWRQMPRVVTTGSGQNRIIEQTAFCLRGLL